MTVIRWPGAGRWPQVPFRYLFRRLTKPVPEGAEIVTAYTDGQVTLRSNRRRIGYHEAADLSNFQGVEPGDFVVHGLDIMRGSVGVADAGGAITSVCIVCAPVGEIEPRYAAYAIRLQAASGYPKALARGVRDGGADFRRWETLAELPLPTPPLSEQRRIADFLDVETERIDRLIAKQSALIETLRERRQAIVEGAVWGEAHLTAVRGNTQAASSPSIRARERSVQLGFALSTVAGWAFASDGFVQSGTRLLRGINVKPGVVDWDDTVYWEDSSDPVPEEFRLRTGDIVLGMDRPFIGGGTRVAMIEPSDLPALLVQRVLRVRPGNSADARFVLYTLSTSAFRAYLEPIFSGVSVPHVSEWQVRKFRMPRLSLRAQREVADHLDEQTAKIYSLIRKAEQFIELAKERRAALITAAVTGQIEVGERAA